MKDIYNGNLKMLDAIQSGATIDITKILKNILINQNRIIKRIENIQSENIFKGLFR